MGTHPIFESDFDCLTDGFDADNLDYGDDVANDTELNRSVRKNETKESKSKDYVSYTITSDKGSQRPHSGLILT